MEGKEERRDGTRVGKEREELDWRGIDAGLIAGGCKEMPS